LANAFQAIEQMEARQLLSVEFASVPWTLSMTNTVDSPDGKSYSSYLMWFQPDLRDVCMKIDPGLCMQDYSWLGKSFEPAIYEGSPAVTYVGDVPYVVDPAAQKKWSVAGFLKEYPHALDGLPEEIKAQVDLFRIDTDKETGVKTVVLCDWNSKNSTYDKKAAADWSGSISLDGVPLEEAIQKARNNNNDAKTAKVRHKKRAHRHHKAPVKKESVFLDRRLGAMGN